LRDAITLIKLSACFVAFQYFFNVWKAVSQGFGSTVFQDFTNFWWLPGSAFEGQFRHYFQFFDEWLKIVATKRTLCCTLLHRNPSTA